jgi:hypothetical protein
MVDVSKILQFLQKCKFDLMREIPGFVDAYVAKDGSANLIIRVEAPLATIPSLSFEDEVIPVTLVVDHPDAKAADKVVVMAGPMQPVALGPHQGHPGQVIGESALPNARAVGPHEQGGRNGAAYEAWKARHKHVKVV